MKKLYILLSVIILTIFWLYKPVKLNLIIMKKLNNIPESIETEKAIIEVSQYGDYALPHLVYWLGKDLMITSNVISCFEVITKEDSLSQIVYEEGKSDTLLISPKEYNKKKKEEISEWRRLINQKIKSKKK